MDDVIDDLTRVAQRCVRAAESFDDPKTKEKTQRLVDAVDLAERAWSHSWLGYQACVYLNGLQAAKPGEFFDVEWGGMGAFSTRTSGDWREFDQQTVIDAVFQHAKVSAEILLPEAKAAEAAFEEGKLEIITTLEAALAKGDDRVLAEVRDTVKKMESHISASALVDGLAPHQFMSRDTRAVQGGRQVPPHLAPKIRLMERASYGIHARGLAEKARFVVSYLQKARKMKGTSVAKTTGPVFIGHGGKSSVWKDLRDFLQNRLALKVAEFNSVPTAGKSTKERLLEMLDTCPFAFLVMTAEDETADKTQRARQNVVHEIGLFQGRYGFERAIVLLEEGCEGFSNIEGVGQIRFPKGNIAAVLEDIRLVLERERILVR